MSRSISQLSHRINQIFACDSGYLSLTHSFGWISELTTTKFGVKELETSLYSMAWNIFRYLEPFRCGLRVWQTGRQTDGQNGFSNSALSCSYCRCAL